MDTRIGWIGLGKMGAPMALNLLKAGFDVTAYNRNPAKRETFASEGGLVAVDAGELAAASDTLFLMMSDDDALAQVLLEEGGILGRMRPGSIIVEMSTVSPGISARLAGAASSRGVEYLRAPVSGSVATAEAAALTVLVSGPRGVFERTRPILEAMSSKQFLVGEGEEARVLKLAVNMLVGATAALLGEALALGEKNGLERDDLLDVIAASAVASPLIGYKLEALRDRDYTPAFEVQQMAKDYDLILAAANASNTPMPLAAQIRSGWSALIARGDAHEDFFKYVELSAATAGIERRSGRSAHDDL